MLKALIYVSDAKATFSNKDLNSLSQKAYDNNKLRGVTGFMCFQHGQFLQYIEGEDVKVDSLFSVIQSDERHQVVSYITNDMLEKPRFSSWNMVYLDKSQLNLLGVETFLTEQLQLMAKQGLYHQQWQDMVWQGVNILANKAHISE